MLKTYFLTFGGPSENYHCAVKRILNQASYFNLFDEMIGLTDYDLKNDCHFWDQHSIFIENNKRGYGYWIWKSYIIKKQLEKMNENEILVYVDAGCVMNSHGKKRLLEYFDMVNNSEYGLLGFQMNHLLEKEWTKIDAAMYIDGLEYMNSGQLNTCSIFRKCPHSIDLVNKWYENCCNYHNINDHPSQNQNNTIFKEHRHDQSIWSILRKKYGCIIIPDETYFHPNWETDGKDFPIHTKRERSG